MFDVHSSLFSLNSIPTIAQVTSTLNSVNNANSLGIELRVFLKYNFPESSNNLLSKHPQFSSKSSEMLKIPLDDKEFKVFGLKFKEIIGTKLKEMYLVDKC
jgi:hypothetical protein